MPLCLGQDSFGGVLTGDPLELLEPGTSLGESLPDFLGFVRASVEFCSHFRDDYFLSSILIITYNIKYFQYICLY